MTRAGNAKRGYDRDWFRLRARHLRAHPLCVVCGAKGEHVDHVQPIRVAPHRRLDPFNLQTLCERHHNRITQAFDKGNLRGACRPDGTPLDPDHPWQADDGKNASPVQISRDLKRDWIGRAKRARP